MNMEQCNVSVTVTKNLFVRDEFQQWLRLACWLADVRVRVYSEASLWKTRFEICLEGPFAYVAEISEAITPFAAGGHDWSGNLPKQVSKGQPPVGTEEGKR